LGEGFRERSYTNNTNQFPSPLSKTEFPFSFSFGESTRRGIEVRRGVGGEVIL